MSDDNEYPPLLNYTPIFTKFCEANEKLLECYHKIDPAEVKTMSKSAMNTRCVSEKEAIKSILLSNEMTMTQVVKDRTKVMYALAELGPQMVYEYTEEDE